MTRRTTTARFAFAAALVTVALAAHPVHAAEQSEAEVLYDEALTLLDKGQVDEACGKLEKSYELDAAVGTRFYLADCYEQKGKLATALAMFEEVERTAHSVSKRKLEDSARKRAEALMPRVARVRLVVDVTADPQTLVSRDGVPLKRADWAEPFPIDPGTHVIDVTAPGKKAFSTTITIDAQAPGTIVDVRVPRLEMLVKVEHVRVVERVPEKGRLQKTGALGAAGLGVVGVGVGTVFGLIALSERNHARDLCGAEKAGPCGSEEGVAAWSDAKDAGNVSTVGFVAGGVLLAAGVVLWLTAPKSQSAPAPARVGFAW